MNIGRFTIILDRWIMYVSRTQFFMVLWLFLNGTKISLWWIFAGFILSIIFMFFDMRYIFPRQLGASTLKNPEWVKQQEKIDVILEQTKKLS